CWCTVKIVVTTSSWRGLSPEPPGAALNAGTPPHPHRVESASPSFLALSKWSAHRSIRGAAVGPLPTRKVRSCERGTLAEQSSLARWRSLRPRAEGTEHEASLVVGS